MKLKGEEKKIKEKNEIIHYSYYIYKNAKHIAILVE